MMSTTNDSKCMNKADQDPVTNSTQETLTLLLNMFFHHQTTVKMTHFSTNSFAVHKATDGYLVKFDVNFDRYMEVLQGAIGKSDVGQLTLDPVTIHKSAEELTGHLKEFRKKIHKISCMIKYMPDLNNIRDEIMADVEQLIYLLTFR